MGDMPPDRDPYEPGSGFPLAWPGMTAQDFTRMVAGDLPPAVPSALPPPEDMPPLPLMVLDTMAGDTECIYTMLGCGDMVPHGLALVGEAHLLDALRSLLADGLVEVEDEDVIVGDRVHTRRVTSNVPTSDSDLQRYWYRMTPAGEKKLAAAQPVLDAYWETHPVKPPFWSMLSPRVWLRDRLIPRRSYSYPQSGRRERMRVWLLRRL
jgi:hypothetical protein